MRVIDTLPSNVAEELKEKLLALIRMTEVTLRRRHRSNDLMKTGFCPVRIAFLKLLKAHRNVATVAASCAAESFAVVVIVVIQH